MKALNPQTFMYLMTGIIILIVVYFALRRIGLIQPLFTPKSEREKIKAENQVGKEIAEIWKAEAKAPENLEDYKGFDLDHHKSRTADYSKLITPNSKVKDIAEDLYAALNRWWGDDEDAIYAALKNEIKNSYQLSQVADTYYNLFQQDLLEKLLDDLDSSELLRVWQIVSRYEN